MLRTVPHLTGEAGQKSCLPTITQLAGSGILNLTLGSGIYKKGGWIPPNGNSSFQGQQMEEERALEKDPLNTL